MTGNIQQRVFDTLASSAGPQSLAELTAALPFEPRSIRKALRRLREMRLMHSICVDGEWRFSIRRGAQRPQDGRGKWIRL